MNEMNLSIDTVAKHPFVHMYIYGLMIHKLGHFHDIVHGTRHDFYMQELRIEFMMAWLDYLEHQGFNPAQLETGEFGRYGCQPLCHLCHRAICAVDVSIWQVSQIFRCPASKYWCQCCKTIC